MYYIEISFWGTKTASKVEECHWLNGSHGYPENLKSEPSFHEI